MKKLGIMFLVGFVLQACTKCYEGPEENIVFTSIDNDVLFGAGDEDIDAGIYVFRRAKDWDDYKVKMDAVNEVTTDYPSIDFDHEMVIVAMDEVLADGGNVFEITAIQHENKKLIVEVLKYSPNGWSPTVITQPFHVISMEKSSCDVELRLK